MERLPFGERAASGNGARPVRIGTRGRAPLRIGLDSLVQVRQIPISSAVRLSPDKARTLDEIVIMNSSSDQGFTSVFTAPFTTRLLAADPDIWIVDVGFVYGYILRS